MIFIYFLFIYVNYSYHLFYFQFDFIIRLPLHIMFRFIIASVLIISFTAQTLGGFMIEIDYYFRTAAYEKDCVNKAKPMMHCNGKCQMAKKIMQEQNKDQQAPERKTVNRNDITLSAKSFFASIKLPVFLIIPAFKRTYVFQHIVGRSLDIFHPPQA